MGVRAVVSFTNNTGRSIEDIAERVVRGENKAAERLLALSAAEVPLRDGTLLASGQVEPATDPTEGAAVVYDTPYAARHHEHPEYNFQNGRKGKFLEDPAVQNKDELGAIIAQEVRGG